MYITGSKLCIIEKMDYARNNIIVQTRKGNSISNEQIFSIASHERIIFSRLKRKYSPPQIVYRSRPSPVYNCHGLTFASKRTGIWDTEEIHKILDDDNYQEIPPNEVLPGDIVLYFSNGDIEHSGVVISKPIQETLGIPKVYSKWGSYCEVIHFANNCPYDSSNLRYYRVIE